MATKALRVCSRKHLIMVQQNVLDILRIPFFLSGNQHFIYIQNVHLTLLQRGVVYFLVSLYLDMKSSVCNIKSFDELKFRERNEGYPPRFFFGIRLSSVDDVSRQAGFCKTRLVVGPSNFRRLLRSGIWPSDSQSSKKILLSHAWLWSLL